MNEILITIIFIICLVLVVYWYAGYSVKTGNLEDADGNFIPDAWEEKFGWFFEGKSIIMFVLGGALGYTIGDIYGFPF